VEESEVEVEESEVWRKKKVDGRLIGVGIKISNPYPHVADCIVLTIHPPLFPIHTRPALRLDQRRIVKIAVQQFTTAMAPKAPITAASRRAKRIVESASPGSSPVISRTTSAVDAGEDVDEGEEEVDEDADAEGEEDENAEGDEEDAEGEEEDDDEEDFVSAPGKYRSFSAPRSSSVTGCAEIS